MKIVYKLNVRLRALFAGICLIVSISGNSQVIFDIVPAGGTAGNTNGSGGDPVDDFFNSIRYQVVYTQAELTAAGIPSGATFTQLAWNLTELPGTLSNYSIRIGHTAATNSAAHDASVTTEVKAPFSFVPVMGYNTIPFDVNFTWDGTSNLLVEICTGPSNPFGSPYGGVQAKTGVTSAARFIRADGAGLQCGNNTTTVVTTKPYLRLTALSPAVPPAPTQDPTAPTCFAGTMLDVVGTPDPNVVWYWQTTPLGTSLSNPYTGPYTVFANGTYYLRANDTTTTIWSATSSSVTVSNIPVATTPPSPIADINPSCVTTGTTLTMSPAPMGTEYYWQTVSNGNSDSLPATTPWTVTTSGTYYVAAYETATGCWSTTSSIAVTVQDYIPTAPSVPAVAYFMCTGLPSQQILATAPNSGTTTVSSGAITVSIPDSNPAGTTSVLSVSGVPAGATITELSINFNMTHTFDGDMDISLIGPNGVTVDLCSDNGGSGDNFVNTTLSSAGVTLITSGVAPMTGVYLPEGNLTTLYSIINGNWTLFMVDDAGGDLGTLTSWSITINYTLPVSTIEWFDAASAGTLQGTGSPLEAVGTPLLPNSLTGGNYEFYASSVSGVCTSSSRTLVTVVVSPVTVELLPVSVTCNNGNDGTFTLGTVTCGGAPFTYAVDGGTFGAIPTNLTVGDHEIIVQDNFGQQSGIYTITVGDAPAPTALVVNDFTYDIVDISWTAGGSETQWNIEWGMPGFTPGTGTGEGSATATGTPTYTITGLDGFTTYDIYVSANCGGGTTAGDWTMISQTTLCDPLKAQGFCESFDSDSETQDCWTVLNANGDLDAWDMNYTLNTFSGDQTAVLYTDFNAGANDDWLIMPLLSLTNNEILTFNYRVQSAGEPNDFEIRLSTTGKAPADFTNVILPLASYTNIAYADSSIDLSAYSGDCYIAFHVPAAGLDGWRLYIDQVCVDICIPDPGVDGTEDVCTTDGSLNLNSVIMPGEFNGVWEFLPNPGVVSGSDLNLNLMPNTGTFVMEYIVTTACTTDTTLATVTIHPPSNAGVDGSLDDLCTNWSSINVIDGLTGTIDLGGTWTNNSGEGTLTGSLWTPAETTTVGAYTFDYSVSNGVCPASVSTVTVNLMSCLGMDDNDGAFLSVYPNPVSDVLTIQNMSLTSGVLDVMDIQGKLVYSIQLNEVYGNYQLDMNDIQSGIYVVRITSENGVKESRVVKH